MLMRSTYSAVTLIGPTKASHRLLTPPTRVPQPPRIGGVAPFRELASHSGVNKLVGFSQQSVHDIDTGIEVVLDLVEVAL